MTTIIVARNKKQILLGSDSRITWNGSHMVTPREGKIQSCHLGMYGCSGVPPRWNNDWDKIKSPISLVASICGVWSNTHCLLVSDNKIYMGTRNKKGDAAIDELDLDVFAIGSGGAIAHGFMLGSKLPLRKRIRAALELAATYDKRTAGPFHIRSRKIK